MNSNDKLNDSTHQRIKDRLPFCSGVEASKFGSFYYKEWKSADENGRKEIEEKYLQDIVHLSVYVKPNLAEKIRRILQSFANQKRIKIVDSLLFRLLKPVVWRGLNAVNGHVRANAVALFLMSFPMRDADSNSKDNYESLQKQTETLETFLNDQIPSIRASSVVGVCKICDLYWELIAPNVLKKIFCTMVEQLAFDSVSADVRVAVIKGFMIVLDNPLSHNVLEKLLPQISMSLHDNNEKVRINFLNLLHKVKGTKTIKYWNIASMDQVLARLTVETSLKVQILITKLIQNSFIPANLEPEERLQRGIALIEKNYEAARKFYHFVADTMPSVEFAMEYIILMLRCVYSCVKRKQLEQNDTDPSPNMTTTTLETDSQVDTGGRLTLENRTVVYGLLECGAILWRSSGPKLQLPENLDHHKRLVKICSKIIQECFAFFEDTRINDVLLFYASLLPASSAPYLASSAVKKLKGFEDVEGITSKVYGSLLEAACFWRFKELADMVIIWLDLCGDLDRTCSSVGVRTPSPKRSRQVRFASKSDSLSIEAKPRLGLAYLEFLLTSTQCRQYLVRSQSAHLNRLCFKLEKFINICWDTIKSDEACGNNVGWQEILLADRLQFSIRMLLTKNTEKESMIDDLVSFFVRKIVYHEFQTLELLNEMNERTKLNAEKLLLQFFVSCQHLLMLNLTSDGFVETLCTFLLKITNEFHSQSLRIFCGVASVIYNVVDFVCNCNHTTIKLETLIQPLNDAWCQKFFQLMDEKNEFFIENENFWKPAYIAMKESLTTVANETKDDDTKIFCKTYIEKLTEGEKNIREAFFCFFSTTVY